MNYEESVSRMITVELERIGNLLWQMQFPFEAIASRATLPPTALPTELRDQILDLSQGRIAMSRRIERLGRDLVGHLESFWRKEREHVRQQQSGSEQTSSDRCVSTLGV